MHPTAARLAERLAERGLEIEVRRLSDSARTAALAAAALEVEVGQIVKSLVFLRHDEPVVILCAGDRRVDASRLALFPAPADRVRAVTGFSIGGIPPLGHDVDLPTTVDESLRLRRACACCRTRCRARPLSTTSSRGITTIRRSRR